MTGVDQPPRRSVHLPSPCPPHPTSQIRHVLSFPSHLLMSFADSFPHLWSAILAVAPYSALLRLRATCRAVRDVVDAQLCGHLAVLLAPGPQDEVRCIVDGELHGLPADWRAHTNVVHTLSLVPPIQHLSSDYFRGMAISFTPTSRPRESGAWLLDRMVHGEAFDRLQALSGMPAWNGDDHVASWGHSKCWCGVRRGHTTELLMELGARLRVRTLRSWGMHMCAMPVRAEQIVFHNFDGMVAPFPPLLTLVATISNNGDDIPGVPPWEVEGKVTHATIHCAMSSPRIWPTRETLVGSLAAPLLRRGVDLTLIGCDDWVEYDSLDIFVNAQCSAQQVIQSSLVDVMRWNPWLVKDHVKFAEYSGQVPQWCAAPEWTNMK
ncbi:hypothetical protein CC85DRAFT_326405 [Cutaneotrichosporon oleaginosum]|uniref:F-box domain-containing protein n=1 Tax=Cutaneotrichosporon oleaginosum TaxID=879819 RepID=A0A0J0XU05_9TREE|nr:uncharacterized protein CC85DRAFT_326405 [Cutaneotrichosporon oleaginosum]KLT44550.1 hypothetical protein CC85DRAFT_326405 [Cutaneotrichosporon oleaginosum]TXT13936.1 hypothetical protein COLE_00129 [Cutaneotrichosporon oleaginosum]